MPRFGTNPLLTEQSPLVWVFTPHLIEDGRLFGESYDTEQTKTELALAFAALNLPWIWQPITNASLPDIVTQVKTSQRHRNVVVANFCDGTEDDGYPGPSVPLALQAAGIAYTGARDRFYQISTSKVVMKQRLLDRGVATAPFEVLPPTGPAPGVCARVGAPVMIKPAVSAASYGIGLRSVVSSDSDAVARRDELQSGPHARYFANGPIIAERFILGKEFTVFVMGATGKASPRCLPPVERVFHKALPPEERFLSYERYWGRYQDETPPPPGEPFQHYEAAPQELTDALESLAIRAFAAVDGTGYGRVDIRQDAGTGRLFVLEVNANCGVSSDTETTVGEILRLAGLTFTELLAAILEDGLQRSLATEEQP